MANSMFDRSQGSRGNGSKSTQSTNPRDRSNSLLGMSLGGSVSQSSRGAPLSGVASRETPLCGVPSRDGSSGSGSGVASMGTGSTHSVASHASMGQPPPVVSHGSSSSLAPPEPKHRDKKEKKEKEKKEKGKKEKREKKP